MNAKLNNVTICLDRTNLIGHPVWFDYDVILMGDLTYNYKEVVLMIPWFDKFESQVNKTVFIGDPGRPYLSLFKRRHHLYRVAEYHLSAVSRYINKGFKMSKVYKYFHIKPRRVKPKQLRIYLRTTPRQRGTKWPKRPTSRWELEDRKKRKRRRFRKTVTPPKKKKRGRKSKGKVKS